MPLIKGKSKQAFEHNIKAEMAAGKPQDQALAIAYDVKRRAARKKMAKGGMPKEAHQGGIDEVIPDKGWGKIIIMKAEGGEVEQHNPIKDMPKMKSKKLNQRPIKHPKMVSQGIYKTKLEEEMMAHGGDVSPSHDEGESKAHELNEERPDRQGPELSDKEKPHSEQSLQEREASKHPKSKDSNPAMRRSSQMELEHEMMEQPLDEAELEHASSIAAAVMARRRKMAKGGEILSEDSIYSDDSDQVDLSRNAQEDANMEDRLSFDALRKENYSESDALDQLDQPMDSNLHGDEEEKASENDHSKSIADRVRSRMKRSPIQR